MIELQDANTIVPIYAISYVKLERQVDGKYSVIIHLNNSNKITLSDQQLDTFERIKSMILAYENK